MARQIVVFGLEGIPEVKPGDDLAGLIVSSVRENRLSLKDNDILIVTQKVVSKAENRLARLRDVLPSRKSEKLAAKLGKDPRHLHLILGESRRILRAERGIVITETRHGFICANSGVDQSNVGRGTLSLLPLDPDASARRIRTKITAMTGKNVAVIISDTFGRPFREGHTDVAIGVAGITAILDYKGRRDRFGNEIRVTTMAIADELASAAELVRGKLDQIPVSLIRGYRYRRARGSAKELIMQRTKNLFR